MIVKVKPQNTVYSNDQWYTAGQEFETSSLDGIEESVTLIDEPKQKPKTKKKEDNHGGI